MKHTLTLGTLIAALAVTISILLLVGQARAADFPRQSERPVTYASTTAYTLTWGASTKIVSTSTLTEATANAPMTAGRSSLTLQTVNCALPTGTVYLAFNDLAAASSTGFALQASSTVTFGDDVPMFHGSIRAISVSANCTLLVTEGRTQY